MKGIILAGGSGTRLYPITKGVIKQLLPVYDKPMIYYPLSVLMLAGIREILIISTPSDIARFQVLLGDGSHLGCCFYYKIQPLPDGIAQAFILGDDFIKDDDVCLVLGDNIFYGDGLIILLNNSVKTVTEERKAIIYAYRVNNPENYGVIEFSDDGNVISIEEKPENPKSNYAAIGLYFFPNDILEIVKNIKPSARGELEITSVNQYYLWQRRLIVEKLGRGFAWFDTGTFESLLAASNFVEVIEKRQGMKISCIEEIAWRMGFIDRARLLALGESLDKSEYGKYLLSIAHEQ